ncbi:MAG: response regulator [Anaerolineae bacterium]|nr:response regulator [Anaerolineae bacterium]
MITYIEDNPNNQRLMQRILSKRGYEVQVFDTAEAGFEAIRALQPRLIFTDLHLKTRATGMDLVRWVREAGIETPIIIVTVFNMIADRKRALAAGCDGYLSKPYSSSDLYQVLDTFYPNPKAVIQH